MNEVQQYMTREWVSEVHEWMSNVWLERVTIFDMSLTVIHNAFYRSNFIEEYSLDEIEISNNTSRDTENSVEQPRWHHISLI